MAVMVPAESGARRNFLTLLRSCIGAGGLLIVRRHFAGLSRRPRQGWRGAGGALIAWIETMIEIHNLSKRFAQHTAVDNLSFQVQAGEVLGFLGPNGAGKSTTMKMLRDGLK